MREQAHVPRHWFERGTTLLDLGDPELDIGDAYKVHTYPTSRLSIKNVSPAGPMANFLARFSCSFTRGIFSRDTRRKCSATSLLDLIHWAIVFGRT